MDDDDREALLGSNSNNHNNNSEILYSEAHSSTSLTNNNNNNLISTPVKTNNNNNRQRDYANENFFDIDLARRASGNTDDENSSENRGLIASVDNEEENGTRIRGSRGDTESF